MLMGIIVGYLVVGILGIALLDIKTKRVRRRLKDGAMDTQQITGGNFKVALLITILALWAFWPFAIYGAVTSKGGGKDGEKG